MKMHPGIRLEGRASLAPQGDRGRFRHGQLELETLARRDIADLVVTGLPTDFTGDVDFCCATPVRAVDGKRHAQLENARFVLRDERRDLA